MDDLRAALRRALPPSPALDLDAVRRRSTALRRRRRAVRSGAVVLSVGVAAGAVVLTGGSRSTDVVATATSAPPSVSPTVGAAPASPSPAPSVAATSTIQLAFGGCGDSALVERRIPGATVTPLQVLTELFQGPTAAERPTTSQLGPRTAGAVRSVRLANGSAYVDLKGIFAGPLRIGEGGDAGCEVFDPVGVTLRENFPGVSAVYYALDGDPRTFVIAAGGRCPDPVVAGGLCDPASFADDGAPQLGQVAEGITAPPATRLRRTDEFGTVSDVVRGPEGITLEVNRVDMLGGAAAEAAARARGQDYSNDYFLVDDNPRLRRYSVSPTALVWGSISLALTVEPTRVSVDDFERYVDEGRSVSGTTLFHLQVEDGVVVGIEEQYRP